ncbi:MAG: hypothetical protein JRF69_00620 [Deltaproteobacteria bacterium]|nr:hypothetical protein [Deltaproteobacteria bacterium]MBW2259384.1 hypothetical protein [Deltaproteobacteria bacterium]
MEEKLIDKIELQNGLTLELHDRSRKVAGDRWLVSFEARIDIEVDPQYFEGQDAGTPPLDAIQRAVGDKVTYSYEKSRNFIAATEKDEVFEGLKERFLTATLPYFSSANFPRNIILSEYRAAQRSSKLLNQQ